MAPLRLLGAPRHPGGAAENIIRPDQEIVPTWEQFKAGDDPALDWALAYHAP